ncbi:putative amidase [Rhodococcus phage E3]|uniref:endolysin n=1 Tax=Rhodococcus phage E3 TaxID=1007869 RepID=UPI0002C6CA0A|nr:endolysin [Rhodococcus phage E3]AEQ21012.1 putative amidase [Rhodococcus phage E3]
MATRPVFTEYDETGVSPNHSQRWGARIRLFVLHTQEGPGDARSLARYLQNPSSGVSYHYTGDNNTVIDVVDTDRASWSVLDANPYCINFCFAGSRASQSREVWLREYGNAIRIAAWLFIQDAKKYGYDKRTISHDEIRAGKSGGTDHYGITKGIGIGSHSDCGPNFPWDVYQAAITEFLASPAPAVPALPPIGKIEEQYKATPWLGKKITREVDLPCPDGRGRYAEYEHGFIYWTPTTGARPIPSYLMETYRQLGFESGPLGYPTAFNTVLPGGEIQAFEGGTLYRKGHPGQNEQPGYFVKGLIGEHWKRAGFENSTYGWPTSNEEPTEDGVGRVQRFERGTRIIWPGPNGTVGERAQGAADTIIGDGAH